VKHTKKQRGRQTFSTVVLGAALAAGEGAYELFIDDVIQNSEKWPVHRNKPSVTESAE